MKICFSLVLVAMVAGGSLWAVLHPGFPSDAEFDRFFSSDLRAAAAQGRAHSLIRRLESSASAEEDARVRAFIERYEVAYRETHNQGLLEALDGVGVGAGLFGDVVCQLHKRLFSDPHSHTFWPRVRTRIRKLRYCADVIGVAEVERVAARMESQDRP
jgi:hypothetical protein